MFEKFELKKEKHYYENVIFSLVTSIGCCDSSVAVFHS